MGEMMMLRALGPVMMIAPLFIGMVLGGPLVLYLVARWRANRDRVVDPQLGTKVALGYFAFVALQLVLIATFIITWMIMSKMPSEATGDIFRVGFGILVPSAIVLGVHMWLLGRTNQVLFPGVRRLYQGYNFFTVGIVGLIAIEVVFQALFTKGSSGELGRIGAALFLVYGTAWLISGVTFIQSRGSTPPAPEVVTPPAADDPGQSLPHLGDGSFPPLQK
jgi:hypothetical protein